MPVYDFICPTDGEFEQICLATAENPHAGTETESAPCPVCGANSPRVILMGDNIPAFAEGAAAGRKKYRYHTRFHFNYMGEN